MQKTFALTIAYEGTRYVGWQVQPEGDSIQARVEAAIRKVTGEEIRLTVAGRTDAGVHAIGQVAGFRTSRIIPCDKFRLALQHSLPDDIVIRSVRPAVDEFHATYDSVRKRYRYIIRNCRVSDPFTNRFSWWFRSELDISRMRDAAAVLLGTHDFRSFESNWPNKATSIRTVEEIVFGRCAGGALWSATDSLVDRPVPEETDSGDYLWMEIVADGFLYNMVRAIMGTLVDVGRGRWDAGDVERILKGMDRSLAGSTAPACGLFMVAVEYPADRFLTEHDE